MAGFYNRMIRRFVPLKEDASKTEENEGIKTTSNGFTYETLSTPASSGTFTLDEAIDNMGFGVFQLKITFFTGLCWMADAMEIMILSILGPTLVCEWHISTVMEALLTTLVFVGYFVGAGMWGKMSDIYGRKASIYMCAVYTVFYGILSAFSPNYIWLLILRFLVGVGIGGVPQAVTIFSEVLPTEKRFAIVFIQLFWSFGTVLIVLAAVFIMPSYGWRYLVLVAGIPCFAFCVACYWMPESMRYDLTVGNIEGVMATLRRVARDNKSALPAGTLHDPTVEQSRKKRGRIRDLFQPGVICTTSLLWFIWGATCFCYYGIVLMSTELFTMGHCDADDADTHDSHEDCWVDCKELSQSDYVKLLWTSFAEFPGIILCFVTIEVLGRKKAIALMMSVFSLFTLFTAVCINEHLLTVILFIARSCVTGAFQALYVYTPEVYSTEIRAIGLGASCSAARIGAIITPFIGQVTLQVSVFLAVSIYSILSLAAAICALLLPIETKGRKLQQ